MPTLANLMVGLGYDLSALEKGSPEAFRLINSQTASMSAEMKRASREGAESFRLIDEALGIHVSRPLTRILTQEFPGLAKALQSVIGVGIGGALVAVGFEAFEKAERGIESARQALEGYGAAIQHTQDVIGDMGAAHVRAMEEIRLELAELSGAPGAQQRLAEFHVDTSAMQEAKKNVEAISKALEEQSKAAEKAHSLWVQLESTLVAVPSDFWSKLFGDAGPTTDKLKEADRLVTLIMREHAGDPMKGLRDSLKEVSAEARSTFTELYALQTANAALATNLQGGAQGVHGAIEEHTLSSGQEKASELAQTLIGLNAQIKAIKDAISEAMGKDAAAGIETQRAAIQEAAAATEHWASSLVKAHEAAAAITVAAQQHIAIPKDQFAQFDDAVRQAEIHYTALYHAIGEDAFYVRFHESLQQVIADMRELAGQKLTAPPVTLPQFAGTATPFSVAAASGLPTLGSGGTTGAQFDAFARDSAAQTALLKQAYAEVMTPLEKFKLMQQELDLVLKDSSGNFIAGAAGAAAYAAAMQKASDELVQAGDHIHKMQEDLQKLLERSDSTSAGVQAFFVQMQIESSQNGKAAFDLLNTGLKGFEDTLTKLVFDGKAKWKDLFRSMGEEAFKFMLNKEVSGLFTTLGGTSIGKSIGLSSLVPNLTGAGGASMTAAATTLQTGSTMLITASTELQSAAANLSIAGVGGSTFNPFSFVPGFASGTDSAPGGFAWVGEQGPELLNLPAGASVTPSAGVRSGGDQHFYIDAKGAEIGVEEKIMRALQRARPGIVGEAVANFHEIQRRTPSR